ncbi:MAG: response regulator [Pseudomonadota bacterium]
MREVGHMTVAGKKVLVVEDELLVAMGLEDTLSSLGCVVVGPVTTLEEAMALFASVEADAAILDVNIRGQEIFAAARILAARGVPLIFCSGSVSCGPLPDGFSDMMQLPKPYTDRAVRDAVRALLTGADAAPVQA